MRNPIVFWKQRHSVSRYKAIEKDRIFASFAVGNKFVTVDVADWLLSAVIFSTKVALRRHYVLLERSSFRITRRTIDLRYDSQIRRLWCPSHAFRVPDDVYALRQKCENFAPRYSSRNCRLPFRTRFFLILHSCLNFVSNISRPKRSTRYL